VCWILSNVISLFVASHRSQPKQTAKDSVDATSVPQTAYTRETIIECFNLGIMISFKGMSSNLFREKRFKTCFNYSYSSSLVVIRHFQAKNLAPHCPRLRQYLVSSFPVLSNLRLHLQLIVSTRISVLLAVVVLPRPSKSFAEG